MSLGDNQFWPRFWMLCLQTFFIMLIGMVVYGIGDRHCSKTFQLIGGGLLFVAHLQLLIRTLLIPDE